ncbi:MULTISPECIES: hypothetical protein [Methylobacterium]|uniref:Uncharacterized protein n=1 Tax=Methylobacterium thuringiense TaxID=1003091 RepID=A0ABQ4TK66_9HYPH|nr:MULTISPECIES: hypothetical protein [Methylobacterium]GJE55666.1 hypothetical protein EKPJFOCH_2161 [Methylobacterium thuringiense]
MHQTRTASAKSAAGKLADAIVEGLSRVLDALGPQQQLQPIPVRVRSGRVPGRR